MNYLGIDYGAAKIGVALATGPLAEPLTTVKTAKALQSIKQLIANHRIDAIIVGDCPENFLDLLSSLNLTVFRADETLSSHDARQSLFHTTQKKRRAAEHAAAAAIILQNWLDASTGAQHQS